MGTFTAPKPGQKQSRPAAKNDQRCMGEHGDIKGGSAPAASKMRSSREYPPSGGHSNYGHCFQREKNDYAVGGVSSE